jgi:hypothetical protein
MKIIVISKVEMKGHKSPPRMPIPPTPHNSQRKVGGKKTLRPRERKGEQFLF